jgi:hypothetical protein
MAALRSSGQATPRETVSALTNSVSGGPPASPGPSASAPRQGLVADDVAVVQSIRGWKTGCTARSSNTLWKSSTVVVEGWETPGVVMVV